MQAAYLASPPAIQANTSIKTDSVILESSNSSKPDYMRKMTVIDEKKPTLRSVKGELRVTSTSQSFKISTNSAQSRVRESKIAAVLSKSRPLIKITIQEERVHFQHPINQCIRLVN